ncbi:DNA polymerase [Kineococcus rubinsiae]|uniref:DNA polymerase n=1 Tax=Kineococcus rubinsiae TaxID=2609562 RepID=UPI00142F80EC|nr:DNA polymerase [Kineococcus rubinsiae]NIZ91674.1 DNA polymerase I [Kineococcus rubinsiae]
MSPSAPAPALLVADGPPTPGEPLALVVLARHGVGLASARGTWSVAGPPARLVADLEERLHPRWVWWSAAGAVRALGGDGAPPVHLARCHDLAAVHRLLHGGSRDDPAAVWAAAAGLPEPAAGRRGIEPLHGTGLLDLDGGSDDALDERGQLSPAWADGRALDDDLPPAQLLARAAELAGLALRAATAQLAAVAGLPEHRVSPVGAPLAVQTAQAESAAALLAVELEAVGLPLDRGTAEEIVGAAVGPRPRDAADDVRLRAARDAPVTAQFGGSALDLRNPAQVLDALHGLGFDVPDTRAWRLERLAGAHPAIEALLRWRKAERLATTYGYGWLDRHVTADGRLRGAWSSADAAAGRMTAQAGLHNLPTELRPAVAAEEGHVLVRADLGQVEPRVLATVSRDPGLVAATLDDDLYAPVAAALAADRPTAKVAVLAAMYGQTSGTAGEALRRMEKAYPTALAYLRAAEAAGREGRDVRTYGGRLLRLADAAASGPDAAFASRGRFARNAVVQGAAAELFKAWAATVRAGLAGTGGRIVLCLHDELLLHVPRDDADAAVALLHTALAQTAHRWAAGSGVRFVAEVAVVRRWSEAK